jgi:hypothetical protein
VNPLERIRQWKSTITWLNTRMPEKYIYPLFTICLGAKYRDGWGGHIGLGKADSDSLFYNGALFIRVMFPFFIGVGIRWAGKDATAREFLQTYIGIKLNGEWAVMPRFRIQSDGSAAAGTTGANYGQAVGWNAGNK